jgi:hypothetical protein
VIVKRYFGLVIISILFLSLGSCTDTTSRATGVYMLLDSSGTYTKELKHAQTIINYLLGTLQSGDSFGIAKIDSASFSEKDIIAKMTFDKRPSVTNKQKRLFKQSVDTYLASVKKGSAYTDITGGLLQASEYLHEAGAGNKYILIFSDLKEDLKKGHIRDFPIQVPGCKVVALNVTKLRSDNIDPREYYDRVQKWEERVTEGGGEWRVINDLNRLEHLLGS